MTNFCKVLCASDTTFKELSCMSSSSWEICASICLFVSSVVFWFYVIKESTTVANHEASQSEKTLHESVATEMPLFAAIQRRKAILN